MNNIAQQNKNGTAPEEITLYSATPELDEDQEAPQSENATLKFFQLDKQRSFGKKFILYDNKQLSISDYTLKTKRQYWFNISYLNASPRAKWQIAWVWGILVLIFSSLAAATSAIVVKPIFQIDRLNALGVAVLCFGFSVLCAFALYRRSLRVLRFYSLNGNVPVFELLFNNPDRATFTQFSQQLQNKIQSAQNRQHLPKNDSLAAELAQHRQLLQNKVISNEVYESVKSRLFSLHNH